ncbi:MAG: hypothetical protein IJY28_00360 [Clostridia bacterium]|nr:hypothetical protein [Clostridia bacterium]
MKKQEKMDIIRRAMDEKVMCRCWFTYDPDYFYYYPNAVNEKFILGQEEDGFILNGYCIRKLSQLKKAELKDDKCNEINRMFGLTEQIVCPDVDITSWQSIFTSLSRMDTYIQIEDAVNDQFLIGKVERVLRSKLLFWPFDADGVWDEEPWEIPYAQITSVQWGTRYAIGWKRYMDAQKQRPDA